ncbi:MAG: MFS transporter [Armatimonadota bacterium]
MEKVISEQNSVVIGSEEEIRDTQVGCLSEADVKHNVKVNVLLDAIFCVGAADFEVAVGPLYVYLNASNALIGLLQSMGMMALIGVFLSPYISRRCPYKKWYLFISHLPYIGALGVLGLGIVLSHKMGLSNPQLLMFVFCVVASHYFFSGFVTLPHQEFLSACIPMRYRGRYSGYSVSLGAVGGIASSSVGWYVLKNVDKPMSFGFLFLMTWFFAQGAYFLALLAREPRTPVENSPIPWSRKMFKAVWHDKPFMKVLILNLVFYAVLFPAFAFVPIYGYKVLHMAARTSALILIIQQVVRAVLSAPMGEITDRLSPKRVLPLYFAGTALAFVPVFLIPNAYGIYIGSAIATLCVTGAYAAFTPLVFGTPLPENRSGHFSVQIILRNLIGGSGPVAFGFLCDKFSFKPIFGAWVVISLVLGLLAWAMLKSMSTKAEDYA